MPFNALSLLQHLEKQKKQGQDQILSGTDPTFVRDIKLVLQDTRRNIENVILERSVSYVLDQNSWNRFGIYGAKQMQLKNRYCGVSYRRGDVLHIDFGHLNFGTEHSYMHKAVVVGDFTKLLVVVPITTDRKKTYSPDIQNAVIPMPKGEFAFLTDDSELLLHQLRVVSKNRIYVKDINNAKTAVIDSLRKHKIMVELEEKIQQLYAPIVRGTKNARILQLESELQAKEAEILSLTQQINSMKQVASSTKGNS